MKPNHVSNSDFMSILYSKPLRGYKEPKFRIGDEVRISKYDLPFRKCYKPQFTQETFEIAAIATKKNLQLILFKTSEKAYVGISTTTLQRGNLCFMMRNSPKQQRPTILNSDSIPPYLTLWKL